MPLITIYYLIWYVFERTFIVYERKQINQNIKASQQEA